MIILHGFYDEGKIEILEKDLPKVKGEVEIIIKEKSSKKENLKKIFSKLNEKKVFMKLKEPLKWQRKLRNEW
ncbi:MAG: hypothetical protein ACP5Q5_06880 [Brevinematia bacterium]